MEWAALFFLSLIAYELSVIHKDIKRSRLKALVKLVVELEGTHDGRTPDELKIFKKHCKFPIGPVPGMFFDPLPASFGDNRAIVESVCLHDDGRLSVKCRLKVLTVSGSIQGISKLLESEGWGDF